MSLITEALKRVQKTTYQQPVQTPPVTSTPTKEQLVDVPQERNRRPRSGLLAMVVLVAVLAVVAGGVAVRVWLFERPLREQASIPDAAGAAGGRTSEAAKPAASTAVKPAEATPPTSAEAVPVPGVMEGAKAEQIAIHPPAPPPEPPKLALQGVMIEGQDREAVINGVSVRVGDSVEGAKVLAIDSRTVRLDFQGSEIVLRLP
jgi:hypothetical protein